jgi:hypothetical protein
MVAKYGQVWATVGKAVDEEEQERAREQKKQLQQFYDDKWKKHNIQVGAGARACAAPPVHAWRAPRRCVRPAPRQRQRRRCYIAAAPGGPQPASHLDIPRLAQPHHKQL